ncbi:MAG: MerR family transcriptional regulator [Halanaerobacter sp.]
MKTEIDPDVPSYSIGFVTEETSLTARQIRYYEEEGLIDPARSKGNQRIYSKNDILELKQIKELMEEGINLAGIKRLKESEED